MCRSVPFLLGALLAISYRQPVPTASWAGSRKTERILLMQGFPGLSPEQARRVFPDIDEAMVRASWPSTLDEAVRRLMDEMNEADKKMVRDTKEEHLILFHYGWGTGIRNEFGLWRDNTNLLAAFQTGDPDRASMVIIKAVWDRLQRSESER